MVLPPAEAGSRPTTLALNWETKHGVDTGATGVDTPTAPRAAGSLRVGRVRRAVGCPRSAEHLAHDLRTSRSWDIGGQGWTGGSPRHDAREDAAMVRRDNAGRRPGAGYDRRLSRPAPSPAPPSARH